MSFLSSTPILFGLKAPVLSSSQHTRIEALSWSSKKQEQKVQSAFSLMSSRLRTYKMHSEVTTTPCQCQLLPTSLGESKLQEKGKNLSVVIFFLALFYLFDSPNRCLNLNIIYIKN